MDEYEVEDSMGRVVRVRLSPRTPPLWTNLQRAYEQQRGTGLGSAPPSVPRLAFQQKPVVVRLRGKIAPANNGGGGPRPQANIPQPPPRTTNAQKAKVPNPSGKPSPEGFAIRPTLWPEGGLFRRDPLTPPVPSDVGERVAGREGWAQMSPAQQAYAKKRARVKSPQNIFSGITDESTPPWEQLISSAENMSPGDITPGSMTPGFAGPAAYTREGETVDPNAPPLTSAQKIAQDAYLQKRAQDPVPMPQKQMEYWQTQLVNKYGSPEGVYQIARYIAESNPRFNGSHEGSDPITDFFADGFAPLSEGQLRSDRASYGIPAQVKKRFPGKSVTPEDIDNFLAYARYSAQYPVHGAAMEAYLQKRAQDPVPISEKQRRYFQTQLVNKFGSPEKVEQLTRYTATHLSALPVYDKESRLTEGQLRSDIASYGIRAQAEKLFPGKSVTPDDVENILQYAVLAYPETGNRKKANNYLRQMEAQLPSSVGGAILPTALSFLTEGFSFPVAMLLQSGVNWLGREGANALNSPIVEGQPLTNDLLEQGMQDDPVGSRIARTAMDVIAQGPVVSLSPRTMAANAAMNLTMDAGGQVLQNILNPRTGYDPLSLYISLLSAPFPGYSPAHTPSPHETGGIPHPRFAAVPEPHNASTPGGYPTSRTGGAKGPYLFAVGYVQSLIEKLLMAGRGGSKGKSVQSPPNAQLSAQGSVGGGGSSRSSAPKSSALPKINRASSSTDRPAQPTKISTKASPLDDLIDTFRRAGAFRSIKEENAARQLWMQRANVWSRENRRPPEEFLIGVKSALDVERPENSLLQTAGNGGIINNGSTHIGAKPPLAGVSDILGATGTKTTPIALSIADSAKTGKATLPSGATFDMFGGPYYDIPGYDPNAGRGHAWASATEKIANDHHERAARGALIQFPINNTPENVLASHGNLAVRAEVEHAQNKSVMEPGYIPPEVVLSHIVKTVEAYNNTAGGKKKPIPVPTNIKDFLAGMDIPLDTFVSRLQFAKMFWSKPTGLYQKATNPYGTTWVEVAKAMQEPSVVGVKGTNSVMNALRVDPTGVAAQDTNHPIYGWGIKGKNTGLTVEDDITKLLPSGLLQAAEKSLIEQKAEMARKGKNVNPPTRDEIVARAAGWAKMGDGNRKFVKDGIIEVPTADVLRFFRQEGEGHVKAWYDANTRTLGALTGKSDFSSFVHETWHDWTQSLTESHTAMLEKHFGKRDTREYHENGARAFERYLRDGKAPLPELKELFQTIRDAMVRIYSRIRGTPIAKNIHPEVRQIFDQILGKSPADVRTKQGATNDADTTNILARRDAARAALQRFLEIPADSGGGVP